MAYGHCASASHLHHICIIFASATRTVKTWSPHQDNTDIETDSKTKMLKCKTYKQLHKTSAGRRIKGQTTAAKRGKARECKQREYEKADAQADAQADEESIFF